jgi:lipopolysaccharide biosynthesis glycosyltransferase
MFHGRWVALPYIYNALKSLRWEGVHDAIWRDNKVKNVHYILSPKPWDEVREGLQKSQDPSHVWWIKMNEERIKDEELRGKKDEF